MWDFLSSDNYGIILGDIICKVRDGYKDYNYKKLFREFWQKSPRALKDSLLDKIDRSGVLPYLSNIKDKENISLILKDATITVREKLIYSNMMNIICEQSILKNEWDFLQFLIRECFPSKNEMLKFKVEFEKTVMAVRLSLFKQHFVTKKQEWDLLFRFSDDSICEHVKSNVEEGESSSSKRF